MNDLQKIDLATDLVIRALMILQNVGGMTPDQVAEKIRIESAKTDELISLMK